MESPTFVINNTISASRNHNGEFYCKVYIIQAGTETLVKTVSFSLSVNCKLDLGIIVAFNSACSNLYRSMYIYVYLSMYVSIHESWLLLIIYSVVKY